jgi:hypothetical protein
MSIDKLSNRHTAIINFIVGNPQVKLGTVAMEFGMTQAWLSCVIHSSAFKSALAAAQVQVFEEVTLPLREKLEGVSHRAVEKLGVCVDNSQDPKFILDAADKTLKALGFAPTRGPEVVAPIQQNNFFTVDKGTLEKAREGMQAKMKDIGEAEKVEKVLQREEKPKEELSVQEFLPASQEV